LGEELVLSLAGGNEKHSRIRRSRTRGDGFGDLGVFRIDPRKILVPGKLLAADIRLSAQNIDGQGVTHKIFQRKHLARRREARPPRVGSDGDWRRPRMGTVWLFWRARVKVTCHRNLVFRCEKPFSLGAWAVHRMRWPGKSKWNRMCKRPGTQTSTITQLGQLSRSTTARRAAT